MEPASLAYVTVIIAGISLQSAEPVPLEQCTALKESNPSTLCIDVEPSCGKGEGAKCLGRADLEEAPKASPRRSASKKKHTVYRSARAKRSSYRGTTVGQLVQSAF